MTNIGNEFNIRHKETDRIKLERVEYIDYLFHRLFALMELLLKRTDRTGR